MEKITGFINAYVMPASIEFMRQAILDGDTKLAVSLMAFTASDYTAGEDSWALVGRATVTVEIPNEDALRAGVLGMLKKRREKVVAEKTAEIARIDERINQLLAIACEAQS